MPLVSAISASGVCTTDDCMNDEQLGDLKQFFESRISQTDWGCAKRLASFVNGWMVSLEKSMLFTEA
jgi:hypothetical protein